MAKSTPWRPETIASNAWQKGRLSGADAIERLPLDGTASAVSQADALAMVRGTREAAAREIDRQAHICSYACDHAECKKARDDARRIRALPDTAYLDTEA